MNTKKHSPVCVSSSPHLSVRMAALGLIIILAISVSPAAFGVVYVNKDATGANDGLSWVDAYTTIQEGIDDADVSDDEVWVAQGAYYEAIVMKSGVALYGGFNGTETDRSERNWTTNVTTLDGSTARNGSPAFHVVTMDSITSSTIDGFTITGGNGYAGGGIYCLIVYGTNTITNNNITGNSSTSGAGIYCSYSSPRIENNTIMQNSGEGITCSTSSPSIRNNTIAQNSDGGIKCFDNSTPWISNNTISDNTASLGAGIYCSGSSPKIISNIISANSASGTYSKGGGIASWSSSPRIENNTICGNSAVTGGGISCEHDYPTIVNNSIWGNSAVYYGGGIFCNAPALISNNMIVRNYVSSFYSSGGGIYSNDSPKIINNTILENSARSTGGEGGGISCYGGKPEIKNNTILANWAYSYGGGIRLIYFDDGTIMNNVLVGNSVGSYGGGIYLRASSPSIRNNIICGSIADDGAGIYCYNLSSPQIINNTISSNWALDNGGGICCKERSSPQVRNNIFFNNNKYDIYEDDYTLSDPIVTYNDLYGNSDGVYYNERSTPYTTVSAMDAAIAECSDNIGLNPLFTGGTLSGGTWKAVGDYDFDTFQTTLADSSASWETNAHAGRLLNPNTSQHKQSVIVGNTATTITVWGDVSDIAQIGDTYKIFDYHLQSTSPCIDAGGYVSDLSQDLEGDPRPWDGVIDPRGDGSDFDIGADEYIGLLWHGFTDSQEGWTTGTAVVFSAPQWVFEPGGLKLISQTNTNTFGFWVSPENAIPVSEGYLYRARFVVSTDVAQPELVPQIRLRVNSRNFQQADCLAIDSSGDGGASPTPDGKTYDLYFVPPTNDDFCMLAFDLLNFNPYDAARAELYLESVLVERFRLDTLDDSTVTSWTYDFETSQEFWFPGDGTFAFTDPEFFWSDGALHLWSMTNTNTFGYWHSDPIDIIIEEDRLYRGTFEVRTDEPDRSRVPQMRLRFNTANMQAARTLEISSIGDGANSPGVTNTTYDRLYFLPPPNCVGKGLIVSFDILNFDPADAAEASLILDRATIETFLPPALP